MAAKRGREGAGPLALAAAYPFEIPAFSYLFAGGAAVPLVPGPEGRAAGGLVPEGAAARDWPPDWAARTAVIACGSNRAPAQLRRKFAHREVIPVVRAGLAGFDVVYSAHFTRYGAIPATLCPSPGARAEVSVLWLTAAQLERLHESESLGLNYAFGRLPGVRLELEAEVAGRRVLDEAFAYASLHGCLTEKARPLGLAEVEVTGRAFPARRQAEVLGLARDRLAPGAGLESFVAGVAADAGLRGRYVRILKEGAATSALPGFTPAGA